ncbi:hypothetical protein DLAC_04554 [Tieghemostelium lacteum]|uniref:Sepiapterin reductase n=1 Tax=Tieghemostelium lacteum TaxID=361077 RepID=A0A151ZK02_TIELA|nr:hypothetical protein DLAC_04554 [Tieghemostelium lacteum]|eukprot:KYQ94257.1 hypothetical protein DLAC_04554 [Tieghemostelium lacteum]
MSRILSLVTGGSRGFGVAIVEEVLAKFQNSTIDFILYARPSTQGGLEKTKQLILSKSPKSTVSNICIDLSIVPEIEAKFMKSLENVDLSQYSKVLFFVNHGSLSYLEKIKDLKNFNEIQKDIDLNVTSVTVLTSLFLRKISTYGENQIEATLINTSSLCAIKPFDSWSVYCSGKAARDMLFQCIADEYKSNSKIKSLNYAPGPMDTDMQKQIREHTADESTRNYFIELKNSGKLVNANASASKLSNLLYENTFTSGAHIDYFDLK